MQYGGQKVPFRGQPVQHRAQPVQYRSQPMQGQRAPHLADLGFSAGYQAGSMQEKVQGPAWGNTAQTQERTGRPQLKPKPNVAPKPELKTQKNRFV